MSVSSLPTLLAIGRHPNNGPQAVIKALTAADELSAAVHQLVGEDLATVELALAINLGMVLATREAATRDAAIVVAQQLIFEAATDTDLIAAGRRAAA